MESSTQRNQNGFMTFDKYKLQVVGNSKFMQRLGQKAQKMIFESLTPVKLKCGNKLHYKVGMYIDFFIVAKGKLSLAIRKYGVEISEEFSKQKDVNTYDVICCHNLWRYIENYTQNSSIRYMQAVGTNAALLMIPVMKYKHIIKVTSDERMLVKFISKAVPTLENYSFSTKMRITEHFTAKQFKAGEWIVQEGEKPDYIIVIQEGECEIIKQDKKSSIYRGEGGIGLLSESIINNKIRTVSIYHWIAEESAFYNKPLNYSIRAKSQ